MVTPKQKFIIDTQNIKGKELNIPLYKIKSQRKEIQMTCTTAKNNFK